MADSLIEYGSTAKLDGKDKKILEILENNARISIASISRKTGIQRDSIIYRIKRMTNLKVIRMFHTVLNPSLLGYPIYCSVNIVLQNINASSEKKLLSYLRAHASVVYIAKVSGKWDYTLNITAKNMKDFDEILTELRRRFSKIVKDYETASIIQEYKYDSMTSLVKTSP